MRFHFHVPYFANSEEPTPVVFKNKKDLFSISTILYASREKRFSRFTVVLGSKVILIAEFENGKDWQVLGNIEGFKEEILNLGIPERAVFAEAEMLVRFKVTKNPTTRLWEISDLFLSKKVGTCLQEKDCHKIMLDLIESELKSKTPTVFKPNTRTI
jgi:hypothetical protein